MKALLPIVLCLAVSALLAGCYPAPSTPVPTGSVPTLTVPEATPVPPPTASATPSPQGLATAAPVSPAPPLALSATPQAALTLPAPVITTPVATRDTAQPEYRAFWVDAFHPGIKSPTEVDRLVADMQAANANVIFAQVRRRGDAYYNKAIEPRSDELRRQPDYDPLAYLIARAHGASPPIEVHAWLTMMPVARRGEPPTQPEHVYFAHGPSAAGEAMWLSLAADGTNAGEGNYFLDPGHPAAAQYLADVALNLVRNYDVDGLHLDYIRYAGAQFGYNPISVARFMTATGTSATPAPADPAWGQWRRDQVTHLVRQIYLEAIALKPGLKVSAATIAWGSGPTDDVSWRRSGPYADVYQDWLGWMAEGILDLAVPMNYDRESDEKQRQWFDRWTGWEKDHRGDRHLAIGIGAFLNDAEGNLAQARRALAPSPGGGMAQGVSFYAYSDTDAHSLSPEKLFRALTLGEPGGLDPLFGTAVRTPDMSWKSRPTAGYLKGIVRDPNGRPVDGLTVVIHGPVGRHAITSGTGFYGVTGLPPGNYLVSAREGGRALASATVSVAAGVVATADLIVPAP